MQLTVINDVACDPQTNMANDVALWQCVESAPDQAFLRFYDWIEPCVTYGRNQTPSHQLLIDVGAGEGAFPLVCRPTGGGIVFHQPSGITYSLIVPLSWLPFQQLIASYRCLGERTVEALKAVGIGAMLRQESLGGYQDKRHHEVCVSYPAKYEIVSSTGQKLIGSAQRKGRVSLLQQTQVFGDVPLAFKEALFQRLTVFFSIDGSLDRR